MTTRRIVTGHAPDGRSVVIEQAAVPHVRVLSGARFDEVWSTGQAPEPIDLVPSVEPTSMKPASAPRQAGA